MALSTIPFSGLGADASNQGVNFRNLIINGDMSIAQRGTSQASISTGYNTCDRWRTSQQIGAFTQSQSTDVPTGQGFATSLKMDCTTANSSPGSTSQLSVHQRLEGQMLQQLKKGTSNAESTTMSFWVKSNKTGTYTVEITDDDNSRQISKTYTINSSDTWEKKTITFEGDTTGTLDNDNARSFEVLWWLGAGSTPKSGTFSTSWSSTTFADRVSPNQVNLADNTANEWYITGVQLEVGTSASDFEFLPSDVNLDRCYRYYQKYTDFFMWGTFIDGNTSTRVAGHIIFSKKMRTAPSVTKNTDGIDSMNFESLKDIGYSYHADKSGRGTTTNIKGPTFDAEL